MTDIAVRLEKLCVSFHGHTVLRDVTAAFPARGISVLVGRSGSGKTTLLRSVNRLNEEFPGCLTTGRVFADFGSGPAPLYPEREGNAAPPDLPDLRRRAGMLFQTPNLFPVSVRRNFALPLKIVGGYGDAEILDRMEASLAAVGLQDELKGRLDIPAGRLSGGQQQRLCLARTLALEPALLLLDEPTASLDVHAARGIESLLREIAERYPVIMVSHSLAQARRLAARIVVCEQGRITATLSPEETVSEDLLARLL